MVRALAFATLLVGCNYAYGLDETRLRDAMSDATRACTDDAPAFRADPTLVIPDPSGVQSRWFSIADDSFAVVLRDGTLYELDGNELVGSNLMPPPATPFQSVRLSPEGDELFATRISGAESAVEHYVRDGTGWRFDRTLLTIPGLSAEVSSPTRKTAGPRRIMISPSLASAQEFVEGQSWVIQATYTAADLAVGSIRSPNLTTDGLHLIFQGLVNGQPVVGYASRSAAVARFGVAVDANPFFGAPFVRDPVLIDDCKRLYFVLPSNPRGVYYVDP